MFTICPQNVRIIILQQEPLVKEIQPRLLPNPAACRPQREHVCVANLNTEVLYPPCVLRCACFGWLQLSPRLYIDLIVGLYR
jgi:hypothetical protein